MTKYTAGWNMPGCLPEMEPAEFDSFEDAKGYILEELDIAADGYGAEAYNVFQAEANDLEHEEHLFTTSEMPDGYVYWVDIAAESDV